jgi:hypothetical protein
MYIFIANIIDIAFYSTIFLFMYLHITTQYEPIYSTEYATKSFTILYTVYNYIYRCGVLFY